jgi:hypothetical protein
MRKIAFIFWLLCIGSVLLLSIAGCKKTMADYEERAAGVHKVCPKCTFVTSENRYYAVDTSKQPNIIYIVAFKGGGWYYSASDVDHLIRVN